MDHYEVIDSLITLTDAVAIPDEEDWVANWTKRCRVQVEKVLWSLRQ